MFGIIDELYCALLENQRLRKEIAEVSKEARKDTKERTRAYWREKLERCRKELEIIKAREELKEMNELNLSKQRYYDLLVKEEKLKRLENGGVDNWINYSNALNPRWMEETLEEFEIRLEKEILLAGPDKTRS
jgi:hypothetical protein